MSKTNDIGNAFNGTEAELEFQLKENSNHQYNAIFEIPSKDWTNRDIIDELKYCSELLNTAMEGSAIHVTVSVKDPESSFIKKIIKQQTTA